ncbi:MAG: hypothetical protein FD145_316 [Candidatus Saganbacteria bacterium]|uniref:FlgD Ig-like domain-containing protein n=1 Tax=Candidatus Saganbacteria bacterium TaxID=2575572 RepID=A0A833L4Q5_UNCSA|nr:MAG: hypothetical protein FD145_316 [Candidatus Saganbacteria bacterium]
MKRNIFLAVLLIFSLCAIGHAKVVGLALNYKNPFNPSIGETTKIMYTLDQSSGVTIYIFNLVGKCIKKINCPAGGQGARLGFNEVEWDGYSDTKELMGNDSYIACLISEGKVIAKCKIAILK